MADYGSQARWLTLQQVCEWFGTNETHIRRLVERRQIPYRKVGGLLRFPEAELDSWTQPPDKPRAPRKRAAKATASTQVVMPATAQPKPRRPRRTSADLDAIFKDIERSAYG